MKISFFMFTAFCATTLAATQLFDTNPTDAAKVLILDEPTSALGQKRQMDVLKAVRRVQENAPTSRFS